MTAAAASQRYAFEDMHIFARKAARYIARTYPIHILSYEDALSEAYVWLYSHEAKVNGLLAASPQRTTRIYRSILDELKGVAEKEKAARIGYSHEDTFWYSPGLVEGLLPLAWDESYAPEFVNDGDSSGPSSKPLNERGDHLAMVMDIRRAAKAVGWNVSSIVQFLGGDRPHVGRRRSLTNAASQAITQENQ